MKPVVIRRVLVANRGEIAVRVIRGCHEEQIEAVAVYSEADREALHVRLADASVCIGPAPSSESYLVLAHLIQAALETHCDAVHPGYGFLSENADFADAVEAAGLVWIGPPAQAIRDMGSKTEARRRMRDAGVPIVPGTVEPLRDVSKLKEIALEVGLPVMLKASAGGGGKGMRRVDRVEDLDTALASARSEALKSFGDDAVYIEHLVENARHVEIQVLADQHGQVRHLFERDCSVQRRHQKVIEEAPCPVLKPEIREAMTRAAVRAAAAVGYVGAGTIEFLLAADGQHFYFLEMNTRLQVEHPITECITGVDLVREQLRIAAGAPIAWAQEDLQIRGHAFECRIYAEDPYQGFRPSPGLLTHWEPPAGPFVRTDAGVESGVEVPIHYDPMLAKLVVWGRDRNEAIERTRRALHELVAVGIPTSIPFFLAILQDPDFLDAKVHTSWLSPERLVTLMDEIKDPTGDADLAWAVAAIARYERDHDRVSEPKPAQAGLSAWVARAWQAQTDRRLW